VLYSRLAKPYFLHPSGAVRAGVVNPPGVSISIFKLISSPKAISRTPSAQQTDYSQSPRLDLFMYVPKI